MVTSADHKSAGKRMDKMRETIPFAVAVRYEPALHRILVTLSNHLEIAINPEQTQTLQGKPAASLRAVEITPAGYSLFFPELDEGIYLPGLMQGIFGTKKWMAENMKPAAPKKRKKAA